MGEPAFTSYGCSRLVRITTMEKGLCSDDQVCSIKNYKAVSLVQLTMNLIEAYLCSGSCPEEARGIVSTDGIGYKARHVEMSRECLTGR